METTEVGGPQWWDDAVFYHIYPLGYCGAPPANDGHTPAVNRLKAIAEQLPHIVELGCNAIYLGPMFESLTHGYDTTDYRTVDRRLGTNDDLRELVAQAHRAGVRIVLDGVYNHVGRGYAPFRDLRDRGASSPYRDWFRGVSFAGPNHWGDGFVYAGWEGNDELVSLNLDNPEVKDAILAAAEWAVTELGVDGLRLDVAYLLPEHFLRDLRARMDAVRPGTWLMGEVIHGDYAAFVQPGLLHAVTNYECYKGLWSSFVDANFFEIAWSFKRLFGEDGSLTPTTGGYSPVGGAGLGRGPSGGGGLSGEAGPAGSSSPAAAYNFADNHDVDRVVESLRDRRHVYGLYTLLFTMPGVPSVYYGSEWMTPGAKRDGDAALRPVYRDIKRTDDSLCWYIGELSRLRREYPAIRYGTYQELHVAHEQFVYARTTGDQQVIVAVNASDSPETVPTPVSDDRWHCAFSGDPVNVTQGGLEIPPFGVRIVVRS